MKKKIMIIGMMLLLILTNCITVYGATTSSVILQANKTEIKAGETFDVVVKVKSPDGINGIDTTYTYDTEKLELVNAFLTDDTILVDISMGTAGLISLMGIAPTVSDIDTNVYTLTFKVKDGVAANSTATVSLGQTYLSTFAQSDSEHTIPEQSITIKVIEQTTPPAGSDTECEHTYGNYTDDKDGKHSATCSKCGEKYTEAHTYKDGACSVCSAKENVETKCEHTYGNYTDNGDGKHSATCSKCGEKHTEDHTYKDGACSVCGAKENVETKCEHTYGNYTDNGDGKHSATCSKCGEKHTEDHTYKDGVCSACGVKQSINSGKDDTADKEYPKAGINLVLMVSIVAVVIVAVAMYKKNQKYKDII